MCNNNGACRKLEGGVTCPSYRATRNEKDATRGRANPLRLAISGQLGPDALSSDAMMDTLKLCVSCKACRHECPTGVDMAKMKIEVLAARVAALNSAGWKAFSRAHLTHDDWNSNVAAYGYALARSIEAATWPKRGEALRTRCSALQRRQFGHGRARQPCEPDQLQK
jgi:ferredoxin